MLEKVGRLAYKLDVLFDWRLHPIFLVAQLEPTSFPTNDPFHRSYFYILPTEFVNGDTDATTSFEIEHLLNKQMVKKGKGRTMEYLVC